MSSKVVFADILSLFITARNKGAEYGSAAIATVSMLSVVFNFLFPNIAFASNTARKSTLSFNYAEKTEIQSIYSKKVNKLPIVVTDPSAGAKESYKIRAVMLELPIEKDNVDISDATNDNLVEQICASQGITDLPCWQDLKAMRIKESFNGKAMVGDSGRSRGWYHIQTRLHGISVECAMDFACSTEWTVKNLIINGYKINRFYAISRHNGGGPMAQSYARTIIYNAAKFSK